MAVRQHGHVRITKKCRIPIFVLCLQRISVSLFHELQLVLLDHLLRDAAAYSTRCAAWSAISTLSYATDSIRPTAASLLGSGASSAADCSSERSAFERIV